jgi:glycosyltransferase involved in cell wall biosynthesis
MSYLRGRLRSATRFARFQVQNSLLMAQVALLNRAPEVPGRVTVVTATHNRPDVLREAIDSVRSQTYTDWEQIIVSDGRDDRVTRLVEEYGDPRIRAYYTYRLPVMGNYQRNCALKHATGEFVLYLDDDNVIYPHCLDTMVAGFSSPETRHVAFPIGHGDTAKAPWPVFKYREIDLLNYMVRRRLVVKAWGQRVHAAADLLLVDGVARMSQGNFLAVNIGHHR